MCRINISVWQTRLECLDRVFDFSFSFSSIHLSFLINRRWTEVHLKLLFTLWLGFGLCLILCLCLSTFLRGTKRQLALRIIWIRQRTSRGIAGSAGFYSSAAFLYVLLHRTRARLELNLPLL